VCDLFGFMLASVTNVNTSRATEFSFFGDEALDLEWQKMEVALK
jgi:hypothetical protein